MENLKCCIDSNSIDRVPHNFDMGIRDSWLMTHGIGALVHETRFQSLTVMSVTFVCEIDLDWIHWISCS
jgi:hypothetical protein